MRATEAVAEARREIEICNACRYCESYCAVFPAMTLQRSFSDSDMAYLANLCHDCKGCFQACQHAPPHEFQINLPKAFAELRRETYAEYSWPRAMGGLFERAGAVLCVVVALSIALVLGLAMALRAPGVLYSSHTGPGAFYAVIPWGVMTSVAGATFGFSLLALALGVRNFWRDTRSPLSGPITMKAILRALGDIATLRYLGNDGKGCNDFDDNFSSARRHFHHALAYGFLLCFASTSVATIYDHFLGRIAPYDFFSLPVLLGTVGGVGMGAGATGLAWIKIVTDPMPEIGRAHV